MLSFTVNIAEDELSNTGLSNPSIVFSCTLEGRALFKFTAQLDLNWSKLAEACQSNNTFAFNLECWEGAVIIYTANDTVTFSMTLLTRQGSSDIEIYVPTAYCAGAFQRAQELVSEYKKYR